MEKYEEIFKWLSGWRMLPKYQLERRADIFFALYLPQIWKKLNCVIEPDKFDEKWNVVEYGDIIPEFPMRIYGDANNKSRNIDYVVFSRPNSIEEKGQIYYVELKTSKGSFDKEQLVAMALHQNIEGLKSNTEKLIRVTRSREKRKKYDSLKKRLDKQWNCMFERYAQICYIVPDTISIPEDFIKIPKNFWIPDGDMLPDPNGVEIDKTKKEVRINPKSITQITYHDVIAALPDDDLAVAFGKALAMWNEISEEK